MGLTCDIMMDEWFRDLWMPHARSTIMIRELNGWSSDSNS